MNAEGYKEIIESFSENIEGFYFYKLCLSFILFSKCVRFFLNYEVF